MFRPVAARWFELLVPRRQVARAVEALAATGQVELEAAEADGGMLTFPRLGEPLAQYADWRRRYEKYWPPAAATRALGDELLESVVDKALARLAAWRTAAEPRIARLEATARESGTMEDLCDLCRAARHERDLDFTQLAAAGPELSAAVFVLPAESETPPAAERVLYRRLEAAGAVWLLILGRDTDLQALAGVLEGGRARRVPLPARLQGTPEKALHRLERRLAAAHRLADRDHKALTVLADRHRLAAALGDLNRAAWLAEHLEGVLTSDYMARIRGWTSDPDGATLRGALRATLPPDEPGGALPAVLDFPPPPAGKTAPTLVVNPPWIRPFEWFARLLGTPGRFEADPSVLVAVIAPLLFGYMFGDIGHGIVIGAAGIGLRRRWPPAALLISGGVVSVFFGSLYGSVFGREDLLDPLWIRPLAEPLTVLVVPLAAGAVLILLSMLLNALEYEWSGRLGEWVRTEAGLALALAAGAGAFWQPGWRWLAGGALLAAFGGLAWEYRRLGGAAPARAFAELAEGLMRLLVNTLSFVRVGAFALAHAGLALAVITLAEGAEQPVARAAVMVLGNGLIIALEGLVVSIQTTRLVLFEFFIRFLRAGGRTFKPLALPGLES